jgi:DNA segregation ATPase FtsK/SpoIIIE-like protein
MNQLEAFPKTTMEVLEQLRCLHVLEVEKAAQTLDALSDDEKIAKRYDKAEEKLHEAQQLVRDIDSAITALQGAAPTVESAVADMKRHAEESGTTVTLSAGGKSVTFGGKDKAFADEVSADLNAHDIDHVRDAVLPADDRFSEAVEIVRATAAASVSLLQRRMSIGYAEAGALLDRMEAEGIVMPAEPGSKARMVVEAVA